MCDSFLSLWVPRYVAFDKTKKGWYLGYILGQRRCSEEFEVLHAI